MTQPLSRRMRSASVTLGITALVAANLTGCAPAAPDNRAVCVDPQTQKRVDDDRCDEDGADYHGSGSGYYWYYLRNGARAPRVGSSFATTSGTYDSSTLRGTTTRGGVSTSGGTVTSDGGTSRGTVVSHGDDSGGTVTRGGFGGGHASS